MQRIILSIIGIIIRVLRGDLKHFSWKEIIKDAEHNKDLGFENIIYFFITIGLLFAIYTITNKHW